MAENEVTLSPERQRELETRIAGVPAMVDEGIERQRKYMQGFEAVREKHVDVQRRFIARVQDACGSIRPTLAAEFRQAIAEADNAKLADINAELAELEKKHPVAVVSVLLQSADIPVHLYRHQDEGYSGIGILLRSTQPAPERTLAEHYLHFFSEPQSYFPPGTVVTFYPSAPAKQGDPQNVFQMVNLLTFSPRLAPAKQRDTIPVEFHAGPVPFSETETGAAFINLFPAKHMLRQEAAGQPSFLQSFFGRLDIIDVFPTMRSRQCTVAIEEADAAVLKAKVWLDKLVSTRDADVVRLTASERMLVESAQRRADRQR